MADPYVHRLRADRLPARKPTEIDLTPDVAARDRIAASLDLLDLPVLRLTGQLAAAPADAWQFEGRLTATAVQPCGITLAPVTTQIDEAVRRVWSPHVTDTSDLPVEIEMGDDETEPLESEIDIGAMLLEALTLALPAFPRAPGAKLDDSAGEAAQPDKTRRPFAGLADLLNDDG